MRRPRFAWRHGTEHEVAPWNPRQELREVVAHGERPTEYVGLVADQRLRHVQHRAGYVGLVHQRHGSVHELEGRADLELSIHLDEKVAQAAERLFAECGRERTQASFHSRTQRHYV